jgi:hypothetical protein
VVKINKIENMRFIKIIALPVALVIILFCSGAAINSDSFPTNKMEIYLLIGQSNMAGRAPIEEQDMDSLENVFLFVGSNDSIWEKAANPLNRYSTIRKDLSKQKMGPGYSFAREMAKAHADATIGLVVNAKGGTKIDLWAPGSLFYKEAVKRTKEAMAYGELNGVLWHQGEADASKYESYTPKIMALINALRSDFDMPNLPFVAGQLSEDNPKRISFNKMILELPGKINNVAVATTENTHTIDSTHFDSQSQRVLGERYAAEMLKLLSQ